MLFLSRSFRSSIRILLSAGKFSFSKIESVKALSSTGVTDSFAVFVLSVRLTLTPKASFENILFIILSDGFELLSGLVSGLTSVLELVELLFSGFELSPGVTVVELLLPELELSSGLTTLELLLPELELSSGLTTLELLLPELELSPGLTTLELLLPELELSPGLTTLELLLSELELSPGLTTLELLLSELELFSLSVLCLEYCSKALSKFDFSSLIFSTDFSSSYTF